MPQPMTPRPMKPYRTGPFASWPVPIDPIVLHFECNNGEKLVVVVAIEAGLELGCQSDLVKDGVTVRSLRGDL